MIFMLVKKGLAKDLKGREALPNEWNMIDKEDYMKHALASLFLSLSKYVLREP